MKRSLALKITLISLVIVTSVLTSSFTQSNQVNFASTVNNSLKQAPTETSFSDVNKTANNTETAGLNSNNNSLPFTKISNSSNTTKSAIDTHTNFQSKLFFSIPDFTNHDQLIESDTLSPIVNGEESSDASNLINNNFVAPITATSGSVNALNFITYTYGGYLIQQPDSNRFFFTFPDNTCQGQVAGSDCITLNSYTIKKIEFDALFITPKINALGFDEMAVFAASDTNTYKGTEFGIRLDLNDGYIYGYNQEPNLNTEDVNFQMLKLTANDGVKHHFSITMIGSEVAFYIDGTDYGLLTFPSDADFSNLSFSIVSVVHRFTDNWDSTGDNMTIENFNLNQQ